MIVLSGADLVLADRLLAPGTLVIEDGRITDIRAGVIQAGSRESHSRRYCNFHHHYIVPGFIDVHVHGVDGVDTLDGTGAVGAMAARLPRYGVTAFSPTTIACGPAPLRAVLTEVHDLRGHADVAQARVLPAHLESNFINPEYRGAQPAACLRIPRQGLKGRHGSSPSTGRTAPPRAASGTQGNGEAAPEFTAVEILEEIDRASAAVGVVTLAPEIDGGLDLIEWLVARGHRPSLGHSAATFEQAQAAIAVGAQHATHLFNRMPPLSHRAPGLVGAILHADEVIAELICDGIHVHPAVLRMAIAAKQLSRVVAITDGTALSGGPAGTRATIGAQPITSRGGAAYLDDGTLAGSAATMDRVFQTLVNLVGLSLVDAATLCATTAARELNLVGHGVLAVGAVADLVVLDAQLSVVQTYVGGELAYQR